MTRKEIIRGICIGGVVALVLNALMIFISVQSNEKKIEQLNESFQRTEMIQDVQTFSKCLGKVEQIKELYLSEAITDEQAVIYVQAILSVLDEAQPGFIRELRNEIEVHESSFPEMTGNTEVLLNATINQINDYLKEFLCK